MSPHIYRPTQLVQEWRGLEFAASAYGLLEQPYFDTGVPADQVAPMIQKALNGLMVDIQAEPFKRPDESNLLAFSRDPDAIHAEEPNSGMRMLGSRPCVWYRQLDGYVDGVDLIREVGAIIERMHTNWLSICLAEGRKSFAEVDFGKGPVKVTREDAVAYHLDRAGLRMKDGERDLIHGYAAVLQSVAAAILLKIDVRWAFLDIVYRSRIDGKMHQISEALARRGGINWKDRAELDDYADTNFRLYYGPDDGFYRNVYEIAQLAKYFARHLNLNIRTASAQGA